MYTTAVAAVLSNWHNVLRAINMASSLTFACPVNFKNILTKAAVKIPKPNAATGEEKDGKQSDTGVPLPQTLVRIPVEQQQEPTHTQDMSTKHSQP